MGVLPAGRASCLLGLPAGQPGRQALKSQVSERASIHRVAASMAEEVLPPCVSHVGIKYDAVSGGVRFGHN